MRSVDVLIAEHRVIESMVSILETAADRLERSREVPSRLLADALEFFHHYADVDHHAKEEELLFPVMADHGLDASSSPIAALSAQHEAARAYLREMHTALARMRDREPAARRDFVATARDYCALLREHIRIEDHYFQTFADHEMSEAEDEALSSRMAALDEACGRTAARARLRRLVDDWGELVAQW